MKYIILTLFMIILFIGCKKDTHIYCNVSRCLYKNNIQIDTLRFGYFDEEMSRHFSPNIVRYLSERADDWYIGGQLKKEDTIAQIQELLYFFHYKYYYYSYHKYQDNDNGQKKIVSFIHDIMQIDSTNIALLYQFGEAFIAWKDYETAIKYYKKVDSLFPKGYKNTKVWINLWEKYQHKSIGKRHLAIYFDKTNPHKTSPFKDINQFENMFGNIKQDDSLKWISPFWVEELYKITLDSNPLKNKDSLIINYIEKGLSLKPDIESYGQLMLYKSRYLWQQQDTAQAIQILGDLVLSPKTTHKNRLRARYGLQHLVLHRGIGGKYSRPDLWISDGIRVY